MSNGIFGNLEQHFRDTYSNPGARAEEIVSLNSPIGRTAELLVVEQKLHEGFDNWSADHAKKHKKIRTVPYQPDKYPDQRLDVPSRPINSTARFIQKHEDNKSPYIRPAIYLGRLAYLNSMKKAHALTVGSRDVANSMIDSFMQQPAYADAPVAPTLVHHIMECLGSDSDLTVGLVTGHLDRLTDVGEFAGALNIALAEESGSFKYVDRVNTLVNLNMTRESIHNIYIPRWLSIGTGIRWGLPVGHSSRSHGISDELAAVPNAICAKAFVKDKKERSEVLALVPAGSETEKVRHPVTHQLEQIRLKDGSATSSLTARCLGGIICANRWGNTIKVGPVIEISATSELKSSDQKKLLNDRITGELARQAHELSGVPVSYTQTHPIERQITVA